MKTYAFRTTHNLMNATVFITPFKWIAKRWINIDPPCGKFEWIDSVAKFFIEEISCKVYSEEMKTKLYPGPKQIVKYKFGNRI